MIVHHILFKYDISDDFRKVIYAPNLPILQKLHGTQVQESISTIGFQVGGNLVFTYKLS